MRFILACVASSLLACSTNSTSSDAAGGTTSSSGGASNGGASKGGNSAGGTSNGGSSNGGTNAGGSSNGGAASGGSSTGGTNAGGSSNGGASSGNNNAGGSSNGGAASGGTNAGGSSNGGAKTSGGSAGATASGGVTATGGAAAGGSVSKGGTTSVPTTPEPMGTYGHDTPGGLGGSVIKVTNLNASGAGSLLAALQTKGPRIVVFEVGGIIDLNLARLTVAEPFVTIAGATAPSPGITLIRGGMTVKTHDVRFEHIRFRMGDAGQTTGFEVDLTTDGPDAYNVVFSHFSVAWGVDENLSVSGDRMNGYAGTSRRVTIENSIIAEGLYDSIHSKGVHSMGTLIHDYCTDVAVVGNLYAHNFERNPWFKAFGSGVVVNNFIYNPGRWAVRVGAVAGEWTASTIVPEPPRISVVGNVMRQGADTPTTTPLLGSNSSGFAFTQDNLAFSASGGSAPLTDSVVQSLSTKPAWPSWLTARPANTVVDWVLANAGARPKDRDSVDARIVKDARDGTGKLVNGQNEVGGYPTATPTQRTLTVPSDPAAIPAWLDGYRAQVE